MDNIREQSLTLEELIKYNEQVLFPALEELFVTKKEFDKFKKEFGEFKNDNLTGQDKILKKLDTLLSEKEIRDYQDKKQKELWAIIINALREHRILAPQDIEKIKQLEFL